MIKSLAIILPVFNESERLSICFKEIKQFNKKKKFKNIEIIFVDDGSVDDSVKQIKKFILTNNNRRVKMLLIQLKKNQGKGMALKKGVANTKCQWILTADIDMSVKISQIFEWIKKKYINNENFSYFGSRNHKSSKIKAKFYRIFLGNIFKVLIYLVSKNKFKDTQCGFKLYNKKYAKGVFRNLITKGYAHDLELIYLLKIKNIIIKELPVKWEHKDKSKLNLLIDPIKMLFDIFLIRIRYWS